MILRSNSPNLRSTESSESQCLTSDGLASASLSGGGVCLRADLFWQSFVGVVCTHTVAFRMLVDFVCVLPPKQVQTQSCSVGVLVVLVASVQNA